MQNRGGEEKEKKTNLHIVLGMTPISLGVQVTQLQLFLLSQENFGHPTGDLPCHKGLPWDV